MPTERFRGDTLRNEYLFNSEKHKEKISSLANGDVSFEVTEIDDTDLWMAVFSVENDDETAADQLSSINSAVARYSPQILACESSDFYIRELYPMSIELERKLRKALYIAASISGDENNKKKFNDLEKMSLSGLFELLFYDQKFIEAIKKGVQKKTRFSKQEIIDEVTSEKESVLWDVLFKAGDAPTLRENFKSIQNYRNDIMHAHNIETARYHEAKQLMSAVVNELDALIETLVCAPEKKTPEQKQITDERISDAYASVMKSLGTSMDAFQNITALVAEMQQPAISEIAEALKQTMAAYVTLNVDMNAFAQISKAVQALRYPTETLAGIQDIVEEQQKILGTLSFDHLLDKKDESDDDSSEEETDDEDAEA